MLGSADAADDRRWLSEKNLWPLRNLRTRKNLPFPLAMSPKRPDHRLHRLHRIPWFEAVGIAEEKVLGSADAADDRRWIFVIFVLCVSPNRRRVFLSHGEPPLCPLCSLWPKRPDHRLHQFHRILWFGRSGSRRGTVLGSADAADDRRWIFVIPVLCVSPQQAKSFPVPWRNPFVSFVFSVAEKA